MEKIDCIATGLCQTKETMVPVEKLREGIETNRQPQIGKLYDCSKQIMKGIMQSQNHQFCDTKDAQIKNFKAQVFEFYRDRKLVKASHCQMVTLDYLC